MTLSVYVKLVLSVTAVLGASGDSLSQLVVPHQNPSSWTENFVQKIGHSIEAHRVKTEDGYILTLHRIPSNREGKSKGGSPVLLHHGFAGASADFLVLGLNNALGFLLAKEGYDVWIANSRGSTDSKRHDQLSPANRTFWDFGWHDVGQKDIPAEIDYILKQTGKPSLGFIGYSMGATAFFVMCSERPEYVPKVNKMIALAPPSYMKYVEGPFPKFISLIIAGAFHTGNNFGVTGEFLPSPGLRSWTAKTFCAAAPEFRELCSNFLYVLFGFKGGNVDAGLIQTVAEYQPAGGSVRQLLHFGQLVENGTSFRKFDYGRVKNVATYKNKFPPKYNISRVTCPVYVFMAEQDWFAAKKDVLRLVKELPDVQATKTVPRANFSHFDFIYARDANELLYQDVVKIFKEY